MSLNTVLRSVGLGQRRSKTSIGSGRGQSTNPGDGFILPTYTPGRRQVRGNYESFDQDAVPLPDSSRPDSWDINKSSGITTTFTEVDDQDISTAGGDFRYDPYAPTRDRRSGREGRQSNDVDSLDDDIPGGPSEPTTKNSLLRPFLASFTIGFADGLTVPFALTAGLSWLGSSHMVITAGSAEICAGCISMGIGGYLSAKGEKNAEAREMAKEAAAKELTAYKEQRRRDDGSPYTHSSDSNSAVEENGQDKGVEDGQDYGLFVGDQRSRVDGDRNQPRKYAGGLDAELVEKYLGPLNLPPYLVLQCQEHAKSSDAHAIGQKANVEVADNRKASASESDPAAEMSPVMSGLSVSFGYLLGGLLPLFPYFFVSEVKQGLIWSFAVCVVALFAFGSVKEFAMCVEQLPEEEVLSEDYDDYYDATWSRSHGVRWSAGRLSWLGRWTRRARRVSSEDIKLSLWEGLLMAGLGSIAAVAAVLCVMLSQIVVADPEKGSVDGSS